MTDKCPFCGQELWGEQSDYHPIRIWKCKTIGFSEGFSRSNQCYEAELACKDEPLREAVGIAQYCSQGGSFSFLKYGTSHPIALKARAFLTIPEVVKVMRGEVMDKNQNQYCDDPYPNASCPCPALPEGMVVVREQDYEDIVDILNMLSEAERGEEYRQLETPSPGVVVCTGEYWEYTIFWHNDGLVQNAIRLRAALEKGP